MAWVSNEVTPRGPKKKVLNNGFIVSYFILWENSSKTIYKTIIRSPMLFMGLNVELLRVVY